MGYGVEGVTILKTKTEDRKKRTNETKKQTGKQKKHVNNETYTIRHHTTPCLQNTYINVSSVQDHKLSTRNHCNMTDATAALRTASVATDSTMMVSATATEAPSGHHFAPEVQVNRVCLSVLGV